MTASEKRVALVTGGSRGIGRAIAEALAAANHHVIITSRSSAAEVVQKIQTQGGEASYMPLDVSDEQAVDNCFKQVMERHGGCDVLVNNAGVAKDFLLMRSKNSDYQDLINVNWLGALYCSRAALRPMMRKQWGRIINISSIIGEIGNPGQTVYASTKAALIGLTKSLAKEVGSRQITVNAIAPGFITTDMTSALSEETQAQYANSIPLGRLGSPEDVAHGVVFLASDAAAYITGQVLGINGGMA